MGGLGGRDRGGRSGLRLIDGNHFLGFLDHGCILLKPVPAPESTDITPVLFVIDVHS